MLSIDWRVCRGRNTWDHPLAVPEDMGVEVLNCELVDGGLGKKRRGSSTVTLTGDAFTGYKALIAFLPAQDPTAMELFIVSADATTKILRVAGGAAAANLTLNDAVSTNPQLVNGAVLNGKLFLAYDSPTNRLKVFSPTQSTTVVRLVGLGIPGAPTIADTGAGTYPAIPRYYRVRYQVLSGTTVLYQSNAGNPQTFTPSGTGTAARVTKPAGLGEGETHWVVEATGVGIDGPYYDLAQIVVGTTTYDDSADPATYNTNDLSPLEGYDFPFPSVKYILSDGQRLFGLGVWETSAGASVPPIAGRVYFTRAFGTSALTQDGDDEVVEDTVDAEGWINLSINAGGVDRGLGGPMNNIVYAFQHIGIYGLVPTEQATVPFRRVVISRKQGAVSHASIVMAQDESGAPALYFLDEKKGPYRIVDGYNVQWIGKDVFDVWQTVNLAATGVVAWGIYDDRFNTVVWAVSTGSSNDPDTIIAFDVMHGRLAQLEEGSEMSVRYGWMKWTGSLAGSRCGVMFPTTLAATRPITQCPYVGLNTGTTLLRQDGASNQDGGTNYQGYVKSKAFRWTPLSRRKRVTEAYLEAKVQAATTITQTLTKDWGTETETDTVSLAAAGSETYVRPRFGRTDFANLITMQTQLGDAAAANTTWELDGWTAELELQPGAK